MVNPASDSDLVKIFAELDADDSGLVTVDELRTALAKKGVTSGDAKKMFEQLDVNSDGRITKYDKNGDGTLSEGEFNAALVGSGIELSKDEAKKFFKKVDASGDNLVDYKEFVKWKTGEYFSRLPDHD